MNKILNVSVFNDMLVFTSQNLGRQNLQAPMVSSQYKFEKNTSNLPFTNDLNASWHNKDEVNLGTCTLSRFN